MTIVSWVLWILCFVVVSLMIYIRFSNFHEYDDNKKVMYGYIGTLYMIFVIMFLNLIKPNAGDITNVLFYAGLLFITVF